MDKNLNYKVIESMISVIDNLLECLTIEICEEINKNVKITCIKRAPSSSIDSRIEVFKDWIEEMFSKIIKKYFI